MSRLPILTFHALDDGADLCGFPAAVFRDGLAHLQRAGYRTVALADAVAAWRRGEALPARTFVLTFDDGYRSVHTEAFPVLRRLGMTATVFLTTGAPDDDPGDPVTWKGIDGDEPDATRHVDHLWTRCHRC